MLPYEFITSPSGDPDETIHNLVGLGALAAELATEGVSVRDLFSRTGVTSEALEDAQARISQRQRLSIYRNAVRLAKKPDVGLLAGARQRISDYGIFGYAMISSKTFGDALLFSLDHVTMAGPAVRQISFSIDGSDAVLRSHGVDELGELLPFAAEFWRSSMTSLFSSVLEAPFPTKRMLFPYKAPGHWRTYERMFGCAIEFSADSLEWHFSQDVLQKPCPNANPITATICQEVCEVVLAETPGESNLTRKIRSACLNSRQRFPPAAVIADGLGLSLRTLHRRLAEEGLSYQTIIDGIRKSLAIELLESTNISMEDIADRVGFADVTGFRKAFKKWTGRWPSAFRPHSTLGGTGQ